MEEETVTNKLVFNVPTKQAPGFVKRQSRMLKLMKMRKVFSNIGPDPSPEELDEVADMWDQIIDFLADYIEAPTHAEAIELLQEASEEQFDLMFAAISGKGPKEQEADTEKSTETPLKPRKGNSGKREKVIKQ